MIDPMEEVIDLAMMRISENILEVSRRIEAGIYQDLGTVTTLRMIAKSLINATGIEEASNDVQR